MSPLSGGLAEIDQRLRTLQRRFNALTVWHVLCLGTSAIVLVSAGLILLGLRADAATFRLATGGAVLLVLAGGILSTVHLRRRWMDRRAAAWVADRRGHLADRLTTVMALQAHPPASRFMPVLVTQTLGLSNHWLPERIQPRRLPRSAYVLCASLLVLASTALVARHAPPPPVAEPAPRPDQRPAPQINVGATRAPGEGQKVVTQDLIFQPHVGDETTLREGQQVAADIQRADGASAASRGVGDAASEGGDGESAGMAERGDEHAPVSIAALSDRLQSAIQRTFEGEPRERPQQRASQPPPIPEEFGRGRNSDEERTTPDGDTRKPGDPRAATSAPARDRAQKDQPASGTPGGAAGKRDDLAGQLRRREGAAPGAGSESSPQGLMGAPGTEAGMSGAGSEGPKTFKLTITSFLRGMEQKGAPPRPSGPRADSARSAAAGGGSTAALSDRQLADDLLRKAEIPPEYEDIVRRVYSARASK